jgi:hypothetical protein
MRSWRALKRFWGHDPGLSILLVALVLLAFVMPPVLAPGEERAPLLDAALTLLVLAGLASLRAKLAVRATLMAVAATALLVRFVAGDGAPAAAAATAVSLGLMAAVVLAHTFRDGPVSAHRVQGAVAAYLLLGLAWAATYALVAALVPGAFASARPESTHARSFLYFSFVTLTTVGYGDITPVHHVARSLAVLEALTGQLYPAILIARLVTLYQGRRSES